MDTRRRSTLELHFREDDKAAAEKAALLRRAFDIEHVITSRDNAYEFDWDGSRAYLAWHDIVLSDGEMRGSDFQSVRGRDLRGRMTFFPAGMSASGWCEQADRINSYAALYFDQSWLFDQLETAPSERSLRPIIYFADANLGASMQKLAQIARAPKISPRLLLDSAALLVGADLLQAQSATRDRGGALSQSRLKDAKDFIEDHLAEDVGLADISAVTGLSSYHFVRAFKISEGTTPYRYLLERRIERAKDLIAGGAMSLDDIARAVGFKSASHFSRTFREIVKVAPRSYRAALKG